MYSANAKREYERQGIWYSILQMVGRWSDKPDGVEECPHHCKELQDEYEETLVYVNLRGRLYLINLLNLSNSIFACS